MQLLNSQKRESQWSLPPEAIVLAKDEIDVWRASLDLDRSYSSRCQHVLSKEELDRANRFHFPKDREHFMAARGLLRIILARYLEMDASRLQFSYNTLGKPSLNGTERMKQLRFNVTHSDGLALFAVARQRDIGIDVERIRPHFADEKIAERFFSPREIAALRELPVYMQPEAFFCCWTRKEACLKARGKGLSSGLDGVEVSIRSARSASLVVMIGCHGGPPSWSIWHLAPMPGYIGALAAEGNGYGIRLRQWDARSLFSRAHPI